MAQCTKNPYLTGKVGDIVYTPNRQGTAVRERVTPNPVNSNLQLAVRATLSTVAKFWRTITTAQRLSWANLAATFPGNLSGFNAFVKINAVRVECAQSILATAPAIPAFGVLTFGATPLAISVTSGGVIAATITPSSTVAPDKYMYMASKPLSAGRAKGPEQIVNIATAASPLSASALGTAYGAVCGTPAVGEQVFMSVVPVTAGFKATAPVFSAVVTLGA